MSDYEARLPEADAGQDRNQPSLLNTRVIKNTGLILTALIGGIAGLLVLSQSEDDPIKTLLGEWRTVLVAAAIYVVGMCIYSVAWATLFTENRRLISLAFLLSQPVKYLPGGIAQPIGQVALAAQVSGQTRRAAVSLPVHILINIVAAITLGAPLLFIADRPSWAGWLVILVPITWTALDRRWMAGLLALLGRLHSRFRVSDDLPEQRAIYAGFALGLLAHGTMFLAFGVLTAPSIPGWSMFQLASAYAVAWLIGYIAIPAPAGLGAREAVLAVLLSAAVTTVDIVRISAVHRIVTLVVELVLLLAALVVTQTLFGRRFEVPSRRPARFEQPDTNSTDSRAS